jgi:hypothetical protein
MHRREFLARSAGALAAGLSLPAFVRAAGDQWGDLVGRFVYDGKAPERKKLKVDKDLPCCGKFDIRDESLLVGADGGLRNVFLYVRSKAVAISPELEQDVPARVTLDNRDCIFQPHCLKLWYPKQEFYTINSDPVAQNIAFEPLGDVPCNAVIPVGGNASYKFTRRQMIPVLIKCNYHPWESGYILPRENPYVDISARDGTFRIAKLPAGELEFQAWHERVGYLHRPNWPKGRFTMSVKPGTNDLGTIKLPAAMFPEK